MVRLISKFTPLRMRISRREPVQLYVEVMNDENESKMLSLYINLSNELSFEKGGFKTDDTIRMESLKPGESKRVYFEVWPKPHAAYGEHKVRLALLDHYNDFKNVKNEKVKNLSLVVER